MSGGSLNYLGSSTRPVDGASGDFERAADILRADGFPDAADRALDAAKALRLAEAIRDELSEVLYVVDRIPCGDDCAGDERPAVEAWRARRST